MDLPKTEQTPDDPQQLPPSRRRRAGRRITPLTADRDSVLEQTALRVSPSFDLFLFSLFAVITINLGWMTDSPALLVLGVLLAPTMTPIVGLSLGTVTGSIRFFGRSLASTLVICVMVLTISAISGYLANLLDLSGLIQVYYHSQLSWHSLFVLGIGMVITTITFVRSTRRTVIASAALSYGLFLPLAVAGFGLWSGIPHLWPDGLVVFIVHLAVASILGVLTLFGLGFRPLTLFGFTLGGVALLVAVIILIGLSGVGAAFWGQVAIPTPIPSLTPTPSATASPTGTASPTHTPIPPSETLPPTTTPTVTPAPSGTPAPSPTPVYAIIAVPEDLKGAILRAAPGFNEEIITSALNGTLVQILSDAPIEVNDVLWLNIRLPDGREGWMLQSTLLAATPEPNW